MSEASKKARQSLRSRVSELEAEVAKLTAERDAGLKRERHVTQQRDALAAAFDSVGAFVKSRKTLALEMLALPAGGDHVNY